jgi:phosphoglucomutase
MDLLEQSIEDRIKIWLDGSYDSKTKDDIRQMLEGKKYEELTDSFYRDLEFGTGGLRGIMGHGTNRVNRYTIGMATQGLSNYLKKIYRDEQIKVVIAHDNRNNAKEFARVTAEVFSANGILVWYFDELRPTPELSFAIRQLGCHSGVMLTASHNPKEYSGYKAYWRDGGQVIAPHDKNIIDEVKRTDSIDKVNFRGDDHLIRKIGPEMDALYLDQVVSVSVHPEVIREQSDLAIVYSPIHGAGVELVPQALAKAGFTNVIPVEEQCTTDGDFPTVVYPNPEEEEALFMSIEKAKAVNADLVMATDPDADRVGVAVKGPAGSYTLLNGNQAGALLIDYVLSAWKANDRLKGDEYVVKTIVTSYLLDRIAESYGVKCVNVLTGFKYIGALMTELEGEETFIAGCEESYGYLVGDHVRDKDAVVACLMFAEMTAWYKSQNKTLLDGLTGIYLKHGLYREKLISLTKKGKEGAAEIRRLMNSYRSDPPVTLGGEKVILMKDYLDGSELDIPQATKTGIDFPVSNVLQFITETGSVISARPSGTEPKIKFYISVNAEIPDSQSLMKGEIRLNKVIEAIAADLDR